MGSTGIGARFSLSMNVKTGKEIGHPSSSYIWDIIATAENCFNNLNIDWKLHIDPAYHNRARSTAAGNKMMLSKRIHFVRDFALILGNAKYIYADPSGEWFRSTTTIDDLEIDTKAMPFGLVVLQIDNINKYPKTCQFPYSTIKYLIETLERGEEPMEIEGRGNYSAVSGWKAFARWMQGYTIPLQGIQHSYLNKVVEQLAYRRNGNALYWLRLTNDLEILKERDFAVDLAHAYGKISNRLQESLEKPQFKYQDVKEIYYAEQETLPIYKRIKSYLNTI